MVIMNLSMQMQRQLCPVCQGCGVTSYLQSYQINLDEAVLLCQNKKCTYPLNNGGRQLVPTYSRCLAELPSQREEDSGHAVPKSQLSLQARVASHMKKLGGNLQRNAKGNCSKSPYRSSKQKSNAKSTGKKNHVTCQEILCTAVKPFGKVLTSPIKKGFDVQLSGKVSLKHGKERFVRFPGMKFTTKNPAGKMHACQENQSSCAHCSENKIDVEEGCIVAFRETGKSMSCHEDGFQSLDSCRERYTTGTLCEEVTSLDLMSTTEGCDPNTSTINGNKRNAVQIGSPQLAKQFEHAGLHISKSSRGQPMTNGVHNQRATTPGHQNGVRHQPSSLSRQSYSSQTHPTDIPNCSAENSFLDAFDVENNSISSRFSTTNTKSNICSLRKRSGSLGSSDSSHTSSCDNLDQTSEKSSSSSTNHGYRAKNYPSFQLSNSTNIGTKSVSTNVNNSAMKTRDIDGEGNLMEAANQCSGVVTPNELERLCFEANSISTKNADSNSNSSFNDNGTKNSASFSAFQFQRNGVTLNSNANNQSVLSTKNTVSVSGASGVEINNSITCNLTSESICSYPKVFLQWENADALCWLDVVLCLSVHNETLKRHIYDQQYPRDCLIYHLFMAHFQAQQLLQSSGFRPKERPGSSLSVSSRHSTHSKQSRKKTICTGSKLGKELKKVLSNQMDQKSINNDNVNGESSAVRDNQADAISMLNDVREKVWTKLKTRLRCTKGQHESPVFAFPLFLKQNPRVAELFTMKYRFEYTCTVCEYTETGAFENMLPTLPNVTEDFTTMRPAHRKSCPRCSNSADQRHMIYESLPECVMMHFTDGLPSIPWSRLTFSFHGNTYTVTGVVQYLTNPNHFVAWLRNPIDDQWMECDDLKDARCQYSSNGPGCPGSQVHIVMWERLTEQPNPKARVQIIQGGALINTRIKNGHSCSQTSLEAKDFDAVTIGNSVNLIGTAETCAKSKSDNFSEMSALPCTQAETDRTNLSECKKGKQLAMFSDCGLFPPSSPTSVQIHSRSLSNIGTGQNLQARLAVLSSQSLNKCSRTIAQSLLQAQSIDRSITQSTSASPSSSLSSKSRDSMKLPEFIDTTPVTLAIQKPVPCKSVDSAMHTVCEHEHKQSVSLSLSKNEDLSPTSMLKGFTAVSSKITGPVTQIQPSTVFCKPTKCAQQACNDTNKIHPSVSSEQLNKSVASSTSTSSSLNAESKSHNITKEDATVNSESSVLSVKGNVVLPLTVLNRTTPVSIPLPEPRVKSETLVSAKTPDSKTRRADLPVGLRNSFRVPSLLKRKAPSNYMKEAFPTLKTDGKGGNSTDSSCNSVESSPVASPALAGNLSNLSSIKQYLLNRATAKSSSSARFEGLSLTTTYTGGLPKTPQKRSEGRDSLPNLHGNLTERKLTDSQSLTASMVRKKPSSYAGFDAFKLKRKLDIVKSKESYEPYGKKHRNSSPLDNASCGSSLENRSLKENDLIKIQKHNSTKALPKQRIGGKNMALVTKWANQTEGGWNGDGLKSMEHIDKLNIPRTPVKSMPQTPSKRPMTPETCNVLQDLYEALNIPFTSAKDTLDDIMTDVDDILGIVDTNEILSSTDSAEGGTAARAYPLSPVLGQQNKMNCWLQVPGRNSV